LGDTIINIIYWSQQNSCISDLASQNSLYITQLIFKRANNKNTSFFLIHNLPPANTRVTFDRYSLTLLKSFILFFYDR
jgi:hypothetical protein